MAFLSLTGPELAVARVAERVRPRLIAARLAGEKRRVLDVEAWKYSRGAKPMKQPKAGAPSAIERVNDLPRILDAMREAVREALLRHMQAGHPVAAWQDGRVVWIQPEDIPLAEGDEALAEHRSGHTRQLDSDDR